MNLDQPIGWMETVFLALVVITPIAGLFAFLAYIADEWISKFADHD